MADVALDKADAALDRANAALDSFAAAAMEVKRQRDVLFDAARNALEHLVVAEAVLGELEGAGEVAISAPDGLKQAQDILRAGLDSAVHGP